MYHIHFEFPVMLASVLYEQTAQNTTDLCAFNADESGFHLQEIYNTNVYLIAFVI